jgi:nucleotide-binding universal stress UspA family protein
MPQFTEMRRQALWVEASPTVSRTFVVGYDGSQAARRALRRAVESAGSGGHVQIVTATSATDELELMSDDPSVLIEEATALVAGSNVGVSTRIDEADPVEALARAADRVEAELIVVGARGDSYFARALRGSVGERLIALAPCDLLIVR